MPRKHRPTTPITFWHYLRSNLGLINMEDHMARQDEAITDLGNKFDSLGGVVTDIEADFRAFRDAMNAERENLSEAGTAALEQANAKADVTAQRLAELDVQVGDADGSDTPAPVEPTPTDPGTGDNA